MTQRFFRNSITDDQLFFDEGPTITNRFSTSTLTSSIDTTLIDGYRQGVEITNERHYARGFIKIHSGEPGSRLLKSNLGSNNNTSNDVFFEEANTLAEKFKDDNFVYNGVLEPLVIRDVVSFKVNQKDVIHSLKATLQSGNEGMNIGSDIIVDSFINLKTFEFIPFSDEFRINNFTNNNLQSFDMHGENDEIRTTTSSPYVDQNIPTLEGITINSLSTYVELNNNSSLKRFTVSGWDFESGLGTDSITFGGLTY